MICSPGRPEGQPDPKKPADSARRSWGLGRESGDHIKGCDGTWIHAVGSLAGADGWNITNVAAFPISSAITPGQPAHFSLDAKRTMPLASPLKDLIFNTTCE